MVESLYNFIHFFDLIGKNPELLIFSKYRNNSILASLASIGIIFLSIIFAINSTLDYLKFKNPNITFSKDNDVETNRNFL